MRRFFINKSGFNKISLMAVFLVAFASLNVYGDLQKDGKSRIIAGKDLYIKLNSLMIFQRDAFLDSQNKSSVNASGILKSIGSRDKKLYRAVISDDSSEKYGLKIIYYIYFTDINILSLMKEGERYSFNGKFSGWTPLDSMRNDFIFDIALDEISRVEK